MPRMTSEPEQQDSATNRSYALWLLFAINVLNFYDRQIISALTEPIRKEFALTDGQVGGLGTAFVLFYAAAGIPLGRLADLKSRKRLLAAGVFVWSLFTALAAATHGYWQLLGARLGVGAGEAVCAPAATSLLGDLFPASRRGKAMSIFMLGLPAGIALSYVASGRIAQVYGWRAAFLIAGVPGLLVAASALFLREPKRGAADETPEEPAPLGRSPFLEVLAIPRFRWIVLSGVFHNFNLYALGTFLTAFLMRYHGLELRRAADLSGVVFGLSGLPGLLLGGPAADIISRRGKRARLVLAAALALASAPLAYLALTQSRGDIVAFSLLLGTACALTYGYYPTVYPAIQDIVPPRLRGSAMAVYFFAMYVLGGAFGSWITGGLSDHFTKAAAQAARVVETTPEALEPFRAEGLRSAMTVIPCLGVALALVLFAAALSRGHARLKTQGETPPFA